jgi:hypothetical protein
MVIILLNERRSEMKKRHSLGVVNVVVSILLFLLLGAVSQAQFADSLVLFIVADAAAPNAAEEAIRQRLEEMDFDFGYVGQNEASIEGTAYAALILISATVSSGTVADNMIGLRDLPIPVINWEPFLYDSLGFQGTEGGEFNTSEIEIVNPDHPLAAGLPEGPSVITSAEKGVSYGAPQGDVVIIAINAAVDTQAVLFGYETGATMYVGTAPARRVGTFLLNDAADALTEEGWALFDASVKWAMSYEEPNAVQSLMADMPAQFTLDNNYPNPFNPTTHIAFSLPKETHVRLTIYNSLGQKIATLVDELRAAGSYTVTYNADAIPSGVYYYRLEAGSQTTAKKMLLLK